MTNQEAQVIIKQLGGQWKLEAMIAAKIFFSADKGVVFSFKGSRKYNYCIINLTANDTYNMKIYRDTSRGESNVVNLNDIYCNQLKELFVETTGLRLSL